MKIKELFDIRGKKFFITGGHTGVGRMIAEGVIKNGGQVVISGRRSELVQKTSEDLLCTGFTADISTDEGIQRCVDIVGDLDVLINCAGTSFASQFDEFSEYDWDKTIGVNLTAPFLLTQAFLPHLRGTKEQPAVVINIGSTEAVVAAGGSAYGYNASKAALMHMPFKLQDNLAKQHINWNTINLGPFDTELLSYLDQSPDRNNEHIKEHNPQKRIGTKNEVIGPIIYLSSKAGQYIKGRTIEVSGGITAYLGNYMTKGNYLDWHTKQWMPVESRTYPYEWKRAKPEDPKGLFDIGKDDLCLCNSGKKYKHCCGEHLWK